MSGIFLETAEQKDFERIYELMADAFPQSELRTKDDQMSLLNRKNYKIHVYKKDGKIAAFIAAWELEGMDFVEHFAVDKKYRGHGLGADLMKAYINQAGSGLVILEVEPPENEVAVRRINFYNRLGFHLNDFPYMQPAMQKGQKPIPLKIMSYPFPIDEDNLKRCIRIFKSHVYEMK